MNLLSCVTVFLSLLCLIPAVASADATEQVRLGEALYGEHCAQCHALTLRGSAHGTALKGTGFADRWQDKDSTALLRYNQASMPPGTSAQLDESEHLAIIAHILAANDIALAQPLDASAPVSLTTDSPVTGRPF